MCILLCTHTHFLSMLLKWKPRHIFVWFPLFTYTLLVYIFIYCNVDFYQFKYWYIVLDEKCLTDILTKLVCDGFNCGNNLIKEVCLFSCRCRPFQIFFSVYHLQFKNNFFLMHFSTTNFRQNLNFFRYSRTPYFPYRYRI